MALSMERTMILVPLTMDGSMDYLAMAPYYGTIYGPCYGRFYRLPYYGTLYGHTMDPSMDILNGLPIN